MARRHGLQLLVAAVVVARRAVHHKGPCLWRSGLTFGRARAHALKPNPPIEPFMRKNTHGATTPPLGCVKPVRRLQFEWCFNRTKGTPPYEWSLIASHTDTKRPPHPPTRQPGHVLKPHNLNSPKHRSGALPKGVDCQLTLISYFHLSTLLRFLATL